MQAFRVHTGKVAPLDRANVDTDQIIPKQFLKRIERSGYGDFLFFAWRRRQDGSADPDFVLNRPQFRGASILVAGKNFGCGSSREHAAWALLDYGFRAVLAPFFADIFATNCTKNGILTATLDEERIADISRRALANPGYQLTVDLEAAEIRDGCGFCSGFSIDPSRRKYLLDGLDEIGITLQQETLISRFEGTRQHWLRAETRHA